MLVDLVGIYDSEAFSVAASELLKACLVLAWGSFEVLCSDVFTAVLNQHPSKAQALLGDERTKRNYQAKNFVSAMVDHDFNLSGKLGDVLLLQQKLDDLATIRATFDVI